LRTAEFPTFVISK